MPDFRRGALKAPRPSVGLGRFLVITRDRPAMSTFDFASEAELFPTRNWKFRRHSFSYRRFPSAAEAVRFAIEELPSQLLSGAYLEVGEERFDRHGIRKLYDSAEYPLVRRQAA
jgi:hypothetical protein